MTKTVSIITAVRNDIQGLRNTYESIKESLNEEIEWIVIDGNSTDGTQNYLKKLDCKYLKWLSEPDNNMYEAMNKGIRMAEGNYLQFLNAGDTLLIEIKNLCLQNETKDLIFYSISKINTENKELEWRLPSSFIEDMNKYPSIPHQSTFIKRNIFERFGYYREDIKYLGDYEFFCRVLFGTNNNISYSLKIDKIIVAFICNGVTFNYRLSLKLMSECQSIQKKYFKKVYLPTKLMYLAKYIISFIPNYLEIANYMRKFIKH